MNDRHLTGSAKFKSIPTHRACRSQLEASIARGKNRARPCAPSPTAKSACSQVEQVTVQFPANEMKGLATRARQRWKVSSDLCRSAPSGGFLSAKIADGLRSESSLRLPRLISRLRPVVVRGKDGRAARARARAARLDAIVPWAYSQVRRSTLPILSLSLSSERTTGRCTTCRSTDARRHSLSSHLRRSPWAPEYRR